MSDQIIINITPDPSINISAVDNNEEIDLNAITLNQGLINHSVTHQSGGSDALAHNLLGGLNGGQSGQYYHMTQNQYDNAVYRYDLPVYQTGDQGISGIKNFYDRPTVNGTGVMIFGDGSDYLPITGGTISGSLNVTNNLNVSGITTIPNIFGNTAIDGNLSITGNLSVTGSASIDNITFDQTPELAGGVGIMRWNDTDGTVDLGLKGGNVTLQLGQEFVVRVVNKTAADLLESQYKVVRIRSVSEGGAQGGRLAVVLAEADNDLDSVTTLGVVTENIDKNQEGFVTIMGQVKQINTTGSLQGETWVDGDVLYLSPTTPGALTKVKPQAPQHTVTIGYVEYAHPINGKIFVKIDNGYELDELHNVRIASPANNDIIAYNSLSGLWMNVPNSGGGGGSVSGDYLPITGGTVSGSLNVTGDITTNNVTSLEYNLINPNLVISNQYDIRSWTDATLESSPLDDANIEALSFNDTGTIMYILGNDNNSVYSYELLDPWDITFANSSNTKSVSTYTTNPKGLEFSPDGMYMYVLDGTLNRIGRYTLPTPWDISSASNNIDSGQTKTISSISGLSGVTNLQCVRFSSDGFKLFVVSSSTLYIYEITLSVAWDLTSSATLTGQLLTASYVNAPYSISFSNDGLKLILTNNNLGDLYQINLAEPYTINGYDTQVLRILSNTLGILDARSIYYSENAGYLFVSVIGDSIIRGVYNLVKNPTIYSSGHTNFNKLRILSNDVPYDFVSEPFIVDGGALFKTYLQSPEIYTASLSADFISTPYFSVASGSYYGWSNASRIYSSSNGVIKLSNNTNTSFSRLQFGGTTTIFPSIKRNSSGIDIRNAADTAFTALRASDITANGIVDATSFAFSPSGSRITSSQNGIVALTNNSGDSFGRLQFGGITTSYPSIVRNGSGIDVRDAANTIFTPLTASNITANGSIYATSGIYATGTIITNNDIEVSDFAKGVVLKSSDGSRFRITVNNSGALTTTQL